MRFEFVVAVFVAWTLLPASAHDFVNAKRGQGMPPSDPYANDDLSKFIPANVTDRTKMRLRGVINRLHIWKAGQTLKVCFIEGTSTARRRVLAIAKQWETLGNIRFDFGDANAPRNCTQDRADIKIAFSESAADGGYWSYIGTVGLNYNPSMNLEGFGADELPQGVSLDKMRGIILHEFGHALGLEHEHQSPAAACDQKINWPAAYLWGRGMGWSQREVEFNLRTIVSGRGDELEFTRHDSESIMHYNLPAVLFKEGERSECYISKQNTVISTADANFLKKIYPDAEEDRVALRRENLSAYEKLLTEDGVDKSKARELVGQIEKRTAEMSIGQVGGNVVQTGPIEQSATGACSANIAGVSGTVSNSQNCSNVPVK